MLTFGSWITPARWQSRLGKSRVIQMSLDSARNFFFSLYKCASSPDHLVGEAAEDTRAKLEADERAINPCDHLKGA